MNSNISLPPTSTGDSQDFVNWLKSDQLSDYSSDNNQHNEVETEIMDDSILFNI